ncbi:MAG TPA: SusC/RagA family TonB-linked outer membrane protein [Longimicrobiales bacterium]|nr:SusC/RagA family TonB-linked outer membrane protein [Longimicrobiales bacterium]
MPSRVVNRLLGSVALFVVLGEPAAAQEGQVSGVIVEERTQTPLANVFVSVPGGTARATTDAAGRFRLTGLTGSEARLRVELIGYRTFEQTVRVGGPSLRISLQERAVELDALVVTGTAGAQTARAVGNAVSAVRAADLQKIAPATQVQDLLKGKVAGVDMIAGQGVLGTGGATRIRGSASLSLTNEPLIYVDGVRLDNNTQAGPSIRNGRQVSRLSDFDPEQIERIEIIKGPAAATLYGTEASAGVIQIITKKGIAGKPSLDLSVRQGANWFMNPEGRINHVYGRDANGNLLELDLLAQEAAAGRKIFSTGRLQGINAGFRGGTDALRYYLAANYDDDVGVVPYNWERRLNTRANVNVTLGSKADVASSMGFVHSKTRFAQALTAWGVIDQITWGSPARATGPTRGFLRAPPDVLDDIDTEANVNRFVGSLQLKYTPAKWLSNRLTVGGDVGEENNAIIVPRNPLGNQFFFGALSLGDITAERRRVTYTTFDYSSTASFDLSPALTSATSVGAQYYQKQSDLLTTHGTQFPSPSVASIGASAVTTASSTFLANKTLGLFVQEQVSWNNRVFLTAAVRGDDNSAFGANYDVATYPKFSATWVVNEEPWWHVSAVNALKLRGAWGRAGQQPDAFAAVQLYRPATGPGDQAVLTPQALGNPDLKPEVGQELELGFDAGLLDDRASIEFTVYDRSTRDAIVTATVAPSAGFPGTQFVNLGQVNSHGIEASVRGQALRARNLLWELGGTVATNSNKIIRLGVPPTTGTVQNREGYPVRSYFFYHVLSASLDANGQVVDAMCEGANGQPEPCSASTPRVYLGQPNPKLQLGLNTTLTLFNRLRLYALVDTKSGFVVNNGDVAASLGSIGNAKATNERNDPIVQTLQKYGWLQQNVGIMKGGFTKLREVSADYSLPARWLSRIGASQGSISVSGRNLATLWVAQQDMFGTKTLDPEIYATGQTQTMLPTMAAIVSTLRLTF